MRNLLIICLLFWSLCAIGQDEKYKVSESDYDNNQVEMADEMRENGKIYVVVGVILIIFAGFLVYLFRTEKKLQVLEKQISEFREEGNEPD